MNVGHDLQFADPFEWFALWLKEAEKSEPNDPNAAALATSTPDGYPSVRMVLIKRVDDRGFCFLHQCGKQEGAGAAVESQGSSLFPLEDTSPAGTGGRAG